MPSAVAESIEAMSPVELLAFLEPKLDEQVKAISQPCEYYDGAQRLAFATAKFREAFSRYFPPLAINWMKVVVDTPAERLNVQGFRFDPDPDAAEWDLDADEDAWRIWQASNMDSGSATVHTDAIKCGISYAMVVPPEKPGGDWATHGKAALSAILPEQATECYVFRDPADRTTRLAALKRWVNEVDGFGYAIVFTPDAVVKFKTKQAVGNKPLTSARGRKDRWSQTGAEDNPIGVVPLVAIENKPDLTYGGRSDLEEAIPIQDAINKYCLDMQVSSEFHAYPQRYATGWTNPTDSAGNELSDREVEVKMGSTRLVTSDSEETNFGSFAPGDVQNYIAPIEQFLDMLAGTTKTPSYAFRGQLSNLSADAQHAADTGLVNRCKRKIKGGFSDAWRDVMRCAFLAMGDKDRGNALTCEVLWMDPERRSITQNIDAAVKMRSSLNVPLEMCWAELGWSPAKIKRAREMMGLPPGGPGSAADKNPLDEHGDVTVNSETGRALGVPLLLGPNGAPLPAAQQPPGQGSTQPSPPPAPLPAAGR